MSEELDLVGKVRLDTTQLDQVGGKISGVFKNIAAGAAAAFAGVRVKEFFQDAITGASDLAESTSKNQVVFGKASESVLNFAANSNVAFGQSKAQALEATGVFGNLLRSVGLNEQKSADLSTSMVKLASDLASFNNTSVDDALEALRSGLVGETEPLKRFGVNLNEATLQAKALQLGLYNGKGVLDANAKAQASYALIMEQTTLAQGDFQRTSAGLANQQRILTATWDDAKAKLGAGLLPVVTGLVTVLARELPDAIDTVIEFSGGLADAFQILSGDDGAQGFGEVMDNLVGNSGQWVGLFRTIGSTLLDVKIAYGSFIDGFRDSSAIGAEVGGLATGFATLGAGVRGFLELGKELLTFLGEHSEGTKTAIEVVLAFALAFKALQTVNAAANQVNGFIASVAGIPDTARKSTEAISDLASNLKQISSKVVKIAETGAYETRFKMLQIQEALDNLKDKTIKVTTENETKGGSDSGDLESSGKNSAGAFLKGLIGGIAGGIGGAIVAALAAAGVTVSAPVWIGALIVAGVAAAAGLIYAFRDEIGNFFTSTLPGFMSDAVGAAGDFGGYLVDKGAELLNGLWDGVKDVWAAIGEWFRTTFTFENLGFVIGYLGGLLFVAGRDLIQGLWNGAKDVWAGVTKFFTEMVPSALSSIGDVAKSLYQKGLDLLGGLWSGIDEVWDANFKFWTELPGKAINGIGNVLKTLYDKGRDLISGLWEGITNRWEKDGPLKFFLSLPLVIPALLGAVAKVLYNKGLDFLQGLWDGIQDRYRSVAEWFSGLKDKITGLVSGAKDWLVEAGKDVLRGLINGIDAMYDTVVQKMKSLGGGIIKGFKEAVSSSSPSKKMHAEGINLLDGLLGGMESKRQALQQTVRSLSEDVLGKMALPNLDSVVNGTVTGSVTVANAGAAAASAGGDTFVFGDINVGTGVADRDGVTAGAKDLIEAIKSGIGKRGGD